MSVGAAANVLSPNAATALRRNVDGTVVFEDEIGFAVYWRDGLRLSPSPRSECSEAGCSQIERVWQATARVQSALFIQYAGVGNGVWLGGGVSAGATDRWWTIVGVATLYGPVDAGDGRWAIAVGPRLEWATVLALEAAYQHVQLWGYDTNGVRVLAMVDLALLVGFALSREPPVPYVRRPSVAWRHR